jgi:hypothetical protein
MRALVAVAAVLGLCLAAVALALAVGGVIGRPS